MICTLHGDGLDPISSARGGHTHSAYHCGFDAATLNESFSQPNQIRLPIPAPFLPYLSLSRARKWAPHSDEIYPQ